MPPRPPRVAMFRGGPARRGTSAARAPLKRPRVVWRFSAGRAIYATPAVDGAGNAYFGSLDGTFYSVDARGHLRWKRHVGAEVYASAALAGELVIFGADDGVVRALGRSDGATRWRFALGPCAAAPGHGADRVRCDADSSPAVTGDGTVLFGGDALYALDLQGRRRWRHPLRRHAISSPAVGAGTVVIGTQQHAVLGLSRGGKLLWRFRRWYHFDATPVLAAGLVLVGCDDRRFYALDRRSGELRWHLRTGGPVRAAAAVTADRAYVGSYDGKLYAVDIASGKQLWSYATNGPIHGAPTVDKVGNVIVGSRDHHLYAVDPQGKLLWKRQLGGDLDGSAVLAGERLILVGCDDGVLYALR